MKKLLFPICIAVVVLLCVGYFYRGSVYRVLDSLKLIPHPEPFTELYFNNSTDLPGFVTSGQKITFMFTVHNVEGKDMVYPYRVYARIGSSTVSIADRTISLRDDEATTTLIRYRFAAVAQSMAVFVDLPDQKQHIDFLVSGR